ncbi:MAG: REP-associated tyrosine transposase, partial [Desulfocucumaceae bacterium]
MPRVSRKLSKTGIYHVMLRGNERRKIFLCDEDRKRFIDILREKGREKEFSVLAYCLMDNHVHLLISEGKDQINRVMKRIGVSYVYYFNKKYKRTGHLFQDRFKSEPIKDDRHLLAAVRYIQNNPVKANMVEEPAQYQWSSYREYLGNKNSERGLTDRDFILKMLSENEEHAIKQFIKFSKEQAKDEFIDIKEEKMP